MPDLRFAVTGVEAPPHAMLPTLVFKLAITNTPAEEVIHSALVRCQVRIEATRRRYSPAAKARLVEVFGTPERWRETLRAQLWTHVNVIAPRFTGETTVDLSIPCSYDFEVVSAKYFDALEDGEIPLTFLFSGTVFYEGAGGALQVGQISWEREASYRMPVSAWRELMARYYPNVAWLLLRKDVFDELRAYRAAHGLPTWEQTIARLLASAATPVDVPADVPADVEARP